MKKHLIFLLSVILILNYLNLAANDYIYSKNEQNAYAMTNSERALCNFRFVLSESYGVGWFPIDGIIITVDGVDYGFINLAWGESYAEEIVPLPSGEVQLYWTGGPFDYQRYHFEVYNPSDELIYTSPDYIMYEGVFFTYQNECIECVPITDFEGVYIPEEDRVNLSWKSPESDDLTGFDIYRNDALIDHVSPSTVSYSDNTEDLENGTYKYCVIPVYPYVCSLEDECFEISIGCLPITDLKGEYIAEKHQIKLSWKAPESDDLTGFNIFRNDELIEHLTPSTTFYTDNTDKLESGDYKYCVLPFYPFACTFVEECFEISINVSIVDYKDNIIVYPNPANNIITIAGSGIANIKIFNNVGQLVLFQQNTNTINVSALTNGIYILSIETLSGSIIQKKIIINH
jgi:hypothetical protein